jgi:hypothetical protein
MKVLPGSGDDTELNGQIAEVRLWAGQRTDDVVRFDLLAQDAELADLHAAYHETVNRQHGLGNIVSRAIKGEIGIGKTALANAFLAELPPGARLLRVDCSPAQRELPFFHVGQWLRELTGAMLDQPLEEATALVGHALGDAFLGEQQADIIRHMSELATGRLARANDEADVARHRRFMTVGFRRAFRTILAADLVSLLGAAVLYYLASGSVRGFAFFLGLSTLIDLILTVTFMHPFVVLLARRPNLVRVPKVGIAAGLDVPEVRA